MLALDYYSKLLRQESQSVTQVKKMRNLWGEMQNFNRMIRINTRKIIKNWMKKIFVWIWTTEYFLDPRKFFLSQWNVLDYKKIEFLHSSAFSWDKNNFPGSIEYFIVRIQNNISMIQCLFVLRAVLLNNMLTQVF